jgi:hypothetical protein
VSPAARRWGRLLGFFLLAHLVCALARPLSFSFSGALTDLYVVTYGYYIARRYFRAENAEPVNGTSLGDLGRPSVISGRLRASSDVFARLRTSTDVFEHLRASSSIFGSSGLLLLR